MLVRSTQVIAAIFSFLFGFVYYIVRCCVLLRPTGVDNILPVRRMPPQLKVKADELANYQKEGEREGEGEEEEEGYHHRPWIDNFGRNPWSVPTVQLCQATDGLFKMPSQTYPSSRLPDQAHQVPSQFATDTNGSFWNKRQYTLCRVSYPGTEYSHPATNPLFLCRARSQAADCMSDPGVSRPLRSKEKKILAATPGAKDVRYRRAKVAEAGTSNKVTSG
jgi:hypothetical protein